jgi:hypothetical protein
MSSILDPEVPAAREMAMFPLFITLGAADQPDRPVRTVIDGYMIGFSRRSFETAG